jgi:hypothetical protein
MYFGSSVIVKMHKDFMQDIKTDDLSKLEMIHHLSSGFKAVYTKLTYESMDTAR